MATDFKSNRVHTSAVQRATEQAYVDVSLRSYLLKVYNYMMGGLALTGAISFITASSPAMLQAIYGTPLVYAVMFGPLAFVLVLSFGINKISASTAQLLFWLFAATMGLSLSSIFLTYEMGSIARVFFITSATFGAMSLYGYTTEKDLSSFGSFLFMGLIGLILASVVNIFLGSSALEFAISVIGVLIFTGLTAYDTQRIKASYSDNMGEEMYAKGAIYGALSLYLDFINLFLYLLRLLGDRK
ncbi:MAG: Bax inhibitor-1/YccA family protein [Alphaproteobacteria bacterium]|nr:Bax inhibitor-1/YccA family protein [Alphaproteobacteria bacterium]